ncbi:MAG: hypothetical protein ABI666_10160 [Ferruginibacter sp.]
MQQSVTSPEFQKRTAEYFAEKVKQAKGTGKMLVALEMSNYLRDARSHGLTFEELKQQGFKFATV